MFFLPPAPLAKIMMNVAFVAGQCYPQIKNITQKDQILIVFFQGFQHPEKGCMISVSFANVGVGNDNHNLQAWPGNGPS